MGGYFRANWELGESSGVVEVELGDGVRVVEEGVGLETESGD